VDYDIAQKARFFRKVHSGLPKFQNLGMKFLNTFIAKHVQVHAKFQHPILDTGGLLDIMSRKIQKFSGIF
jgi:hypothetical protein